MATRSARGKATPKSKRRSEATSLARPGDPYVGPDGKVIAEDRDEDEILSVPKGTDKISAETFKPSQRRGVDEIGFDPKTFILCASIFAYTIFGLVDREICNILNVDLAKLKDIRRHDAYHSIFDTVLNEFINANSDLLVARLAAHSHVALDQVVSIAHKGKDERNRLGASRDLLDRAGVRPQDNIQRSLVSKNELRIVVTKDDGVQGVGIELNGERVD